MAEHIAVFVFLIALSMFGFGVIGAIVAEGPGALVGGIVGLVLAGGMILVQANDDSERHSAFMKEEISNRDYRAIASWRNTTCRMDSAIASASADGRILEGEAEPIWDMIREQRRLAARRLVTDIKPTAQCAAAKGN